MSSRSRLGKDRQAPSDFPFPSTHSTFLQAFATHLDPGTAKGAAPVRSGPGAKAEQTRWPWRQGSAEWLGDDWSGRPGLSGAGARGESSWCPCQGRDPLSGQQASGLPANLQLNATEAHCPAGLWQNAGSKEPRGQRGKGKPDATHRPTRLQTRNAGSPHLPAPPNGSSQAAKPSLSIPAPWLQA